MYYVFDTTRKNNKGETLVAAYESTEEVVAHLENIAPKIVGKTRQDLMADAADLGFGTDDREGKGFALYMSEYINFGVIRKDGQPVRCDIFAEKEYKSEEYGD